MRGKWFDKSLSQLGILTLLGLSVFVSGCTVEQDSVSSRTNLTQEPVVDKRLSEDDFGFPSQPPSLAVGKKVYQANCASCHAASYWQTPGVQNNMSYTTPIDYYLMLSRGEAPEVTNPSAERHQMSPSLHKGADGKALQFKQKLTRDERWAVIFYTRYLAGNDDIKYTSLDGKPIEVSAVFGANCAVCHGNRGFADGFLHSGKPSKHGVEGGKVHTGLFQPPPANFHDYKRMYNRSDAQIYKILAEGIYPSAMPYWAGKVDKDKHYIFDQKLLWMLTRYVRQFSYNATDLTDEQKPALYIPSSPQLQPVLTINPNSPVQSLDSSVQSAQPGEKH